MESATRRTMVVNAGGYYAGWLACVVGASRGRWIEGAGIGLALLALHFALVDQRRTELRLLLATTGIGYTVDSAQTALGLLVFSAGQPVGWLAPLWIAVMWMLFSATLRFAFAGLAGHSRLASLIGAAGGPAAYYAGHRLGAVGFHPVPGLSLVVLALVWAGLFPLLVEIARAVSHEVAGRYAWRR